MIMELREKFEAADDDGNDGLDETEVRMHTHNTCLVH